MPDLIPWLTNPLIRNAVVSVIYVVVLLVVHGFVLRALNRTDLPLESRRRWRVQVRNGVFVVLVFGLAIIWGSELRTLALSIMAVAVAIVLATKELILCLTGALLRSSSRAFRTGDRIEVDGVRGDVIDMGPLTTAMLEVGPGEHGHRSTGRVVYIPNSTFLVHRVFNETQTNEFVVHTITVPVARSGDVAGAEARLLAAATRVCQPYFERAKDRLGDQRASQGLEASDPSPSISLRVGDPERIDLQLRFPVPAHRRGEVEQEILRAFLSSNGATAAATTTPAQPSSR